jgi:hypothetical protein
VGRFPQVEAVRIGKAERVDPRVRARQIDVRIADLVARWRGLPAFEGFGDEALERMAQGVVLDSANLTCGTTLGILAHPTLRDEERTRSKHPRFDKLVQEWARRVRESVGELPPERDVLLEHGTTLLAALVAPEFVLFVQLGDGDILVVQEDGRVVRGVERSERHFADETDSLCAPQAWLSMRVSVWPRMAGEALVLLATDGYANSYETLEAFERIGPDYLARVRERGLEQVGRELEAILELTSERGSGDDITLGMIHIPPARQGETPCE